MAIVDIADQYATALASLRSIAEAQFFAGRLDAAVRVLTHGEQLIVEPEGRQSCIVMRS